MLSWSLLFHKSNEKKKNLLPNPEKASREPGSLFYSYLTMKIIIVLLLCVLQFAACKEKTGETRASIVQRKRMPAGKLLVSYRFRVGNIDYSDSLIMQNEVLSDDSARVIYSLSVPSRNHLELP